MSNNPYDSAPALAPVELRGIEPQFLVFEEGIINISDISTITPYRNDTLRVNPGDVYDGLRVTMRSKGTHLDLAGITLTGIESRLNGAAF